MSETIIITEPGVYDLPAATYHADPCDSPSLSAGMISDLLTAPALCFHNSPRLNPAYEAPEDQERFTIGSVAHVMFLEPEMFAEKVVPADYPDWRSGKAQYARSLAVAEGKTAILTKHLARIEAARASFMAHGFTREAFRRGRYEQSIFWRHPVHGFWCRARPDFIADALTHTCDYKTTFSADPARFGRHAFELGYYRRAAWYLEGLQIVLGTRPEHYWFVNQEVRAPFLVSVIELDQQALESGAERNELACEMFAEALETGSWPGYRHADDRHRDKAFRVGLPVWAYTRMDEMGAI